ncbi:Adenosine 3'-phospho 5'-phosphosulfate transporter 2 [Hypsibius exemplaris]|uniref:Adenosine 3'-phospho 5'-phosphosulfate transporter 2 n=1 Tax=Hypsibius exemplaris TaxID=2072580 RepID=A0A9X6RJZ7_HYPEX|nr:Adenosine 3'-phospho 5'-phosphosulfate transporter 2 [Hypsibius exemplaris]
MDQVKELRIASDYETSIDLIADSSVIKDQTDGSFSSTWHRTHHRNISQIPLQLADHLHDHSQEENRIMCCVRIDRIDPTLKFFICSGGIFVCFIVYGGVQELMFRIEGYKEFGWYLTLLQFLLYTLFSFVERKVTMKDVKRRIPIRYYLIIGFLAMATIGLSNVSLAYLNYPTQVVFKCCKLIPVLIGGVLIQGKRYTILDVSAAVCMSIGLIFFVLADNLVQPSFNFTGIVLVILALTADAAIGNIQEKAVKLFHGPTLEVVYYTHLVGAIYIAIGLCLSGELFQAFIYCVDNPKFYAFAILFGVTGYIGVQMVLTLVISFGAFIAMSVTTFRKALSIVLSFLVFSKPFTFTYIWAGAVILLGIYLNIYSRNGTDIDSCWIWFLRRLKYLFCFLVRRRSGAITASKHFSQIV